MKLSIVALLLIANVSAINLELDLKSYQAMQRKINRKELVSIGEAMAAIQRDDEKEEKKEKKSEEKEDKKEEKKEKKEDKEDKKSEEKEEKKDKKEDKEDKKDEEKKDDKESKEEKPEKAEDEEAEKPKKKSKKDKGPRITDTHDREKPIERIKEWTNGFTEDATDFDEHYPIQKY